MNLKEIEQNYLIREPVFLRLKEESQFILNKSISDSGIKIHSLYSRIKNFDSFLGKINRKQEHCNLNEYDPFKDINDIVGLRAVCLFLSDIEKIGVLIRKSFNILAEDNKIENYGPDVFGYFSVHYIVELDKNCSGPRYEGLTNIPFEIQVRTIAMDAWATISHYLDYKTETDIPKELKKDFMALSGLFYVADTHFEMFYGSQKKSRENMKELFEKAETTNFDQMKQEINLDSFIAYLDKRFPDREHPRNIDAISGLIAELKIAGYKSIGDIDRIVTRTLNSFLLYEKENPPKDRITFNKVEFTDIGVVRVIFQIADDNYCKVNNFSAINEKYKKMVEH